MKQTTGNTAFFLIRVVEQGVQVFHTHFADKPLDQQVLAVSTFSSAQHEKKIFPKIIRWNNRRILNLLYHTRKNANEALAYNKENVYPTRPNNNFTNSVIIILSRKKINKILTFRSFSTKFHGNFDIRIDGKHVANRISNYDEQKKDNKRKKKTSA